MLKLYSKGNQYAKSLYTPILCEIYFVTKVYIRVNGLKKLKPKVNSFLIHKAWRPLIDHLLTHCF